MSIYQQARELLFTEGWIKGDDETPEGRCVLGAMARVCDTRIENFLLNPPKPFQAAFLAYFGDDSYASHNDNDETKFDDIINVLELAEKLEAIEGQKLEDEKTAPSS